MGEHVTLINAFTVPPDEGDRFLEHWKDNARVMAAQPGFLDASMYRSIVAGAELEFVNVANWTSTEALDAAHRHPDFTAATRRLMTGSQLNLIARPAVYRVAIPVLPNDLL